MKKDSPITIYDIALIFASKEGSMSLIKDLLAKGANTKAANSHGNTALIMACQEPNSAITDLLINNGSDINARNAIGNTGLIYASYQGRTETAQQLIHAGADVNAFNQQGNTPLIYAAYNGHLPIVQLLVEDARVKIDQRDTDGRSALMWAIIRGKKEVTCYLLAKQADANLSDSFGYTILDWAKAMQRSELEHILTNLSK